MIALPPGTPRDRQDDRGSSRRRTRRPTSRSSGRPDRTRADRPRRRRTPRPGSPRPSGPPPGPCRRGAAQLDESFRPGRVVGDFELLASAGRGLVRQGLSRPRRSRLGRQVALKVSAARTRGPDPGQPGARPHRPRLLRDGRSRAGAPAALHAVRGRHDAGAGDPAPRRSRPGGLGRPDPAGGGRRARPAAGRPRPGGAARPRGPGAVRLGRGRLPDRGPAGRGPGLRATRRGVLHRDIKPANILVNPYGRPLLADFNLAIEQSEPSTASGCSAGRLAYMAPEHLEAFNPHDPTAPRRWTQRSDLYSLGVVLFELLTGRRPFGGRGPAPAGRGRSGRWPGVAGGRARRRGPIDPDIPPALDRALRRCLEPGPVATPSLGGRAGPGPRGLPGAPAIESATCRPAAHLGPAPAHAPPTIWLVADFLPHLLASVINISYNALQIVGHLTLDAAVPLLRPRAGLQRRGLPRSRLADRLSAGRAGLPRPGGRSRSGAGRGRGRRRGPRDGPWSGRSGWSHCLVPAGCPGASSSRWSSPAVHRSAPIGPRSSAISSSRSGSRG